MKLNIIDFRNRYLDTLLCQSGNKGTIVSTMLPNVNQTLPNQIMLALEIYVMQPNRDPASIDIAVEVNEWVNKEQAISIVHHTQDLVSRFLIDNKRTLPNFNLAIFEKNKFVSVAPHNRDMGLPC